jgi:nucleoside-diphosphate-sugar epimerase
MKILVTGCNGNVGSVLLEKLVEKYNVYGTDIHEFSEKTNNYIRCDICDWENIEKSFAGFSFDIVVHCAAIAHNDENKFKAEDFLRVNLDGTKNLVNYFNKTGIGGFIFFSTTAVYGKSGIVSEEFELAPDTDYARSKSEAEKYIIDHSKNSFLILRFSPIYDIHLLNDLGKRVIRKILFHKQFLFRIGNGLQKSSFCHLRNVPGVIDFFIQDMSKWNEVFNIADTLTYSQLEIIKFFKTQQRSFVFYIPEILLFILLKIILFGKTDIFHSFYAKLADDNIFEANKIKKIGLRLQNNLFERNET